MDKTTDTRLWSLASDLRSQLATGEYMAMISQLYVLEAISRKDHEFKQLVTSSTKSRKMLIGELLDAASTALDRLDADYSNELIDPEAAGWSALSADWILQTLIALMHDSSSPLSKGQSLLYRASEKSRGHLSVPIEILHLMRRLYPDVNSVYLPFDESALSVLETTDENQSVTLRPHSSGAFQLIVRALFVADRNAAVQQVDPYSKEDAPEADLTIVMPPFNERVDPMRLMELPGIFQRSKRINSEEAALVSLSADAGQSVLALVPSGLLFRGGMSRLLREWLVDTYGLSSVIEFPPRVLAKSSIGCALLVIQPVANLIQDSVRLVSADSDEYLEEYLAGRFRVSKWRELAQAAWSNNPDDQSTVVIVEKPTIRDNDYILNPARYRTSALDELLRDAQLVNLGNICEIIRPLPIKNSKSDSGRVFHEVLMSNFAADGTIRTGSRERILDSAAERRARRQRLKPGDILLGVKGTIGKVAIVADDAKDGLLAGQTTVIIRLQDREPIVDPAYLMRYLAQPAVTNFLKSLAGGSAISFIRAKDLANLEVPIRPPLEQSRIREIHDEIVATVAESNRLSEKARALNNGAFSTQTQGI